ncbi:TetR/AcrR family transcriptional regulator [Allonocardiopsis opalescens]|nr:TetR/AcrR family transcriptional regulator [Allonocardiopsis opalescens]
MADTTATRRALLDAGRAEFVRHGLAGGRTDRIAALSGVNKQRIYAYFGSKEGLFTAVITDALNDLLEVVPLPEDAGSAGELASRYVEAVSGYHRAHPDLLRLLQWEALELPPEHGRTAERAAKYRGKVDGLARRLGIPPDQAAPLLFGLVGLAAWPHAVPQLAALVFGEDAATASGRASAWAKEAAAAIVPERP